MTTSTIDDLFEQMGHYVSRGSIIVVTNPVVKDMTEEVLKQKSQFDDYAKLPEGTRYFGFFSVLNLSPKFFQQL